MKKNLARLMVLIIIVLLLPSNFAYADQSTDSSRAIFVLPSSLLVVGEEAFSNTLAETAFFPEGFQQIQDKAFAGAQRLKDVYIPKSTQYIADSALPLTHAIRIHGVNNSFAKRWSAKHHIPFSADYIWRSLLHNEEILNTLRLPNDSYVHTINPREVITVHNRRQYEDKSRRPQDRPELNPIDYKFP